uniref:E3 ubiquitin-protein ligase UBR5 ubiquitin-associated domain-containing protein n=2 Tax=Meloidogyne TaxID=189290 RepID=A0A914NBL9_MELIC
MTEDNNFSYLDIRFRGTRIFCLKGLKNAQKNEIKAIALLRLDVQCFEKLQLKMFCKLLLGTIMLPSYSSRSLHYEIVANTIESTAPTDKNEYGPGSSTAPATTTAGSSDPASASANAAANAANRTAKIRRIMMTHPGTLSGGFCRTGVVIDRNRSRLMIPVSSVPEDLIVQCQVVLQGKSRDVIVRELQRTNLNVIEAVNNLLSRDDDEMDDLDDTSEAYLHEELLSLLDAGLRSDGSGAAAAALLDSDSIYSAGDGYEYLISRDLARRKGEDKTKDQNKENADCFN